MTKLFDYIGPITYKGKEFPQYNCRGCDSTISDRDSHNCGQMPENIESILKNRPILKEFVWLTVPRS